jgi:uncharacterized surface protein with fasciclin (FAS1) repeats
MPHFRVPLLVLAACGLLLAACSDDPVGPDAEGSGGTLVEVIAETSLLSEFDRAIEVADFASELAGGPYTVFAPSDEAFFTLGPETVESLLAPEHRSILVDILRHHVVAGRFTAAELRARAGSGSTLETIGGGTLSVRTEGARLLVGGYAISDQDREAANGVVHRLDGVVRDFLSVRERLRLSPSLSTLNEGLVRSGLRDDIEGGVTLLAPLDAGFDQLVDGPDALLERSDLLEKALTYHVIPGRFSLAELVAAGTVTASDGRDLRFEVRDEQPYVNGVRVAMRDVGAGDGVLHLLERPILDHFTMREHLEITPSASRALTAFDISGASVDDALLGSGAGPFTLFVPTNDAFQGLGTRVYAPLLAGEHPRLLETLMEYQLVLGRYAYDSLAPLLMLPTREGTPLEFVLADDESRDLLAGGARFEARRDLTFMRQVDIEASNGLIHLIDWFPAPPLYIADYLFFNGYLDFLAMLEDADLVDVLGSDELFTVLVPESIPGRFLQVENEQRPYVARAHVGRGVHPYDPLSGAFFANENGNQFIVISGNPPVASLVDNRGELIDAGSGVTELEIPAKNGLLYRLESTIITPAPF